MREPFNTCRLLMRRAHHWFVPDSLEFAAKVRWRMRFDHNPLFIELQDKWSVRAYAGARGVRTAPLLHETTHPESLPFDSLPARYLIKASHGCGWNILGYDGGLYHFRDGRALVRPDGSLLDQAAASSFRLDRAGAVRQCRAWLAMRHRRREWAYQKIRPRIVVEAMLEAPGGGVLQDYRFYTFDGEVRAINIGSCLYRRRQENVFFDPAWRPIELTRYKESLPDPLPPRPDRLPEMLEIARRLGTGIDFVRIDLYDSTQGVILGEMTVYPSGGSEGTPTRCPVFNHWLGHQWDLPPERRRQALLWERLRRIRTCPRHLARRHLSWLRPDVKP